MAVGVGAVSVIQSKGAAIEGGLPELTKIFRACGLAPSASPNARIPEIADFVTASAVTVAAGGSFPVKKLTATWNDITIPKVGVDVSAPWEDLSGEQQALMDTAYFQASVQDVLVAFNNLWNTLVFSTTTWGTTVTPDLTGPNVNTVDGLRAVLETVAGKIAGRWPNTLVMNGPQWSKIIEHPSVRERINSTSPAAVQVAEFARMLDLPEDGVLVLRACDENGYIVDTGKLWAGYVSTAGATITLEPTAIITPRWTAAGGSEGQPWVFQREFLFKGTDAGANGAGAGTGDEVFIYRTRTFMQPYVVFADAGAEITDTLTTP